MLHFLLAMSCFVQLPATEPVVDLYPPPSYSIALKAQSPLYELHESMLGELYAIRRDDVPDSQRRSRILAHRIIPRDAGQVDVILTEITRALNREEPDWELVRIGLVCTHAGVRDPRASNLAKTVIQRSRSKSLSILQTKAVMAAINTLGHQASRGNLVFLSECAGDEFWSNVQSEMRPNDTPIFFRGLAILALSRLPHAQSLPVLENLSREFPEELATRSSAESKLGITISMALEDARLREQGLPPQYP